MKTGSSEKAPFILFAPDAMPSTASTATTLEVPASEPMNKTVLVVDDDLDIRFFVQILIQTSGYTVHTASDGIEALQQVMSESPDLIILDIGMAHMDGLQVLRAIRANEPTAQVPIVILSAYGDPSDIEAAMQAGANHYVTKPFDATHLLGLVQQSLDSGR